jgi:hypothetical protein
MDKNLSIVLVDKRPYRKIAQENWGLTNDQMRGKHVHHRIKRCDGGANDPSNLYVCSPSMHRWGWHNGEEWIEWASEGSRKGLETSKRRRETDPKWAEREKERNRSSAKKSHKDHKGTQRYSDSQREKSLKSHPIKRKDWQEVTYDLVWDFFVKGVNSGYKISRQVGDKNAKRYSSMLKFASLGFTFHQLLNTEEYLKECARLDSHPLLHLISTYED